MSDEIACTAHLPRLVSNFLPGRLNAMDFDGSDRHGNGNDESTRDKAWQDPILVSVDAATASHLESEIRQILEDLGLSDALKIETDS